MKVETRKMPVVEFYALHAKIMNADSLTPDVKPGRGTVFTMVTDEFEATQVMADARFMAWDAPTDCGVLQIDNAGRAIRLIRDND